MSPLFTIVTPALNCAGFLPRNIASVRAQQLPSGHIEHWVIDGGSSDGTAALLQQCPEIKFISEKDRGLSDAVNKGIQRATGEWILWLNADDELAPGALSQFLEARQAFPEVRLFCGAQKVFGYDGTLEVVTPGWNYNLKELLGSRTAVVQASTFVHRSVYEKVGLLDESFRAAMDYEWIVRARHAFVCQPLPILLTHYHRRPGSIMDQGIARQHREFQRVRRRYGQSRFAAAEFRIWFYLATEPLRRVHWLRRMVRRVKRVFGQEPLHPMS